MDSSPAIPLEALIECYKADPCMTPTKWVRWAVACADRVLASFESVHPEDNRPRKAIDAARAWIQNPMSDDAARAATRAADSAATRAADSAADAAHAAAYAAYAADNAAYAAAYAAHAAAYAAHAAAYAAHAAAARADMQMWQVARLMEIYNDQA